MLVTYYQQGESARHVIGGHGGRGRRHGVKNGDDEIYELELGW